MVDVVDVEVVLAALEVYSSDIVFCTLGVVVGFFLYLLFGRGDEEGLSALK